MPHVVVSVFELENGRGLFSPKFDITYIEKDSGIRWIINCGGTRAYFVRVRYDIDSDWQNEGADSHFMVNRIITSLFLSGFGLFQAKPKGRLIFEDLDFEEFKFSSALDLRNFDEEPDEDKIASLSDWYGFICSNTLFRRAADDAYYALINPVENVFHIYRGMEWLLKAANIKWQDLAADIGVSARKMREFKRMANDELGQRHGIISGRKARANLREDSTLVADFIYGLCKVRKRVDRDYVVPSPEDVAKIMMAALPLDPYL